MDWGLEGAAATVLTGGMRICAHPGAGGFEPVTGGADWHRQPAGRMGEYGGWGLVVRDLDGDGLLDVFLPDFGANRLFLGDGALGFVLATEHLPDDDAYSYGAAAGDLDGDGDLDLVLANDGPNTVYVNDGQGRFSLLGDAIETWGDATHRRTQQVSLADVDGDGILDVLGATFWTRLGGVAEEEPDANELWLGRGDGRFMPAHDRLPELTRRTGANAAGFLDWDRDGDADLVLINDKPDRGVYTQWVENVDGALNYDPDGQRGLDRPVQGMGLGIGDVNDDGIDDYAISGWNEVVLLQSEGDLFYDAAVARGIFTDSGRRVGWGLDLTDLDNDGDMDLLVAYGPDYAADGSLGRGDASNAVEQRWGLYLQKADGRFVESSIRQGLTELGNRRGFVLADLDGDGTRDLVSRNLSGQAEVYRGLCTGGAWLAVEVGWPGRADPDAVGTRVRIEAGGRSRDAMIYPSTEVLSSSGPPEAWFGLGDIGQVDLLELTWPDGAGNSASARWLPDSTQSRIEVRPRPARSPAPPDRESGPIGRQGAPGRAPAGGVHPRPRSVVRDGSRTRKCSLV